MIKLWILAYWSVVGLELKGYRCPPSKEFDADLSREEDRQMERPSAEKRCF